MEEVERMKARTVSVWVGLLALVLGVLACGGSVSTANVADAWMSADEAGEARTTSYAQDAVLYAQADLKNAPDDTVIKAVWTAVDVADTEPGLVINETEFATGSGLIPFTLSNDGLWPTGSYKVDIYLGEELVKTVEFSVQ
jgi:hypothetical protein